MGGGGRDCWEWQAARNAGGYGTFGMGGRNWLAHRAAYELFVGPIPAGLTLDHLCRFRACVNPAHLEPVTGRENTLRGNTRAAEQLARMHCPQGHPYDKGNTYTDRARRRHCRSCQRARGAVWYQRKKQRTAQT